MGQWAGLPEIWKAARAEDYRQPLYVYACRPENLPEAPFGSLVLPEVGWSFIRYGQGREAFQVMFDHGIHDIGHSISMAQCLTFDLTCYGHHWLVNSGGAPHYGTYKEQKEWHVRTRANNCIAVDGKDIPNPMRGELIGWSDENDRFTIRVRHHAYKTVTHSRTLIYRKDGPLLVIDSLSPGDGRAHSAQAFWHVNGRVQSREKGRWIFTADPGLSFVVLSEALSPETPLAEGPCGGLGGRNRGAGKLPVIEGIRPGDPGWRLVPYLTLDIGVPPEGERLVTAFVPLKDGSAKLWTLKVSDGSACVYRDGKTVLDAALR